MIYMCFRDIKGCKYKSLLDYLNKKCDTFTFMFPKYHCLKLTEENRKLMSAEIETDSFDEEEEKEFQEYFNQNKVLLKSLEPCFLKSYETTNYGGQITGYICEAYAYKLNDESVKILKEESSLFSWERFSRSGKPLPCDLCFYKDGFPVLETVSHENEAWLYLDDSEAKEVADLKIKLSESINQFEAELNPYIAEINSHKIY